VKRDSSQKQKDFFEMPGFKVPAIDPTGAGDALCAGIIRGLLRIPDYEKCKLSELTTDETVNVLLEGEAIGATCVTKIGATTGIVEENVKKILKEQRASILSHFTKIPLH
jgi:sugar/nucleoside kinase (ribokinase family)